VLQQNQISASQSGASPLAKLRVQLLSGLLLGIAIPFLLHGITVSGRFDLGLSGYSSVWLSAGATMAAILFSRRMTPFPGMSAVSAVLPSFAFTYGLVAIGVLALRADYSTVLLTTMFGASVVTQSLLVTLASKRSPIAYFVVPGGHIGRLTDQPEFVATVLPSPMLPIGRNMVIVADLHYDHSDAWERTLAEAALNGVPVYHYKNVLEDLTGRVRIEHLSENSFGSLLPNIAWVKFKRVFDLALCVVLIPLLALPLLIVAVLIKLDSPGPVIFRQERVGYRGKVFKVFKFRTMRVTAPQAVAADPRTMARTRDNDERITRLGRFLRRTRIDELPQMVNILVGEMSWIGPRPEAQALSQWYSEEIPFYAYRHIVRPGITGWAQVNQGHVTDLSDVDEKLQYDFFYVKNFSYWIDVYILVRTVGIVFTGFGSK
jgi:lipopolysaccharide/colanic/teichoic acid biosynthesis glycosyltransferase